jgi:hypothetical protein
MAYTRISLSLDIEIPAVQPPTEADGLSRGASHQEEEVYGNAACQRTHRGPRLRGPDLGVKPGPGRACTASSSTFRTFTIDSSFSPGAGPVRVPGAGEAALVPHAVGFLPGFSGSRSSS